MVRRGLTVVLLISMMNSKAPAQDPFGLLFGDEERIQLGAAGEPGDDDLLLVSLRMGQIRFASSLPAYRTAEGICLDAAETMAAVEAPVSLGPSSLEGWFIAPDRTLAVDFEEPSLAIAGRGRAWPDNAAFFPGGEPCLGLGLLSELLAADFTFDEVDLTVDITPREPWPIEARLARQRERDRLERRARDRADYPLLDNPTRWLSWPVADLALDVTRTANGRIRINPTGLVVGDLAHMTGRLQLLQTAAGEPGFRASAEAKKGDAALRIGDIATPATPLLAPALAGRGISLRGGPGSEADLFSRQDIRGPLPPGWEAELHDETGLRAFVTEPDENGEYVFSGVPLRPGYNRYTVRLFGPHGELRERPVRLFVGEELAPENTVRWHVAAVEAGRSLTGDALRDDPQWTGVGSLSYGLGPRATLRLDAAAHEHRGASVNAGLFTALGPVLTAGRVGWEAAGGAPAVELGAQARVARAHTASLRWLRSGDLENEIVGQGAGRITQSVQASFEGPVQVAGYRMPVSLSAAREARAGGFVRRRVGLGAGGRVAGMTWRKSFLYEENESSRGDAEERLAGEVLVSSRIGPHQGRASSAWACRETCKLARYGLSYSASIGARATLSFGVVQETSRPEPALSASLVRQFGPVSAGLTARTDGTGRWRAGVGLRFAIYREPGTGRPRLARAGASDSPRALVRVFEDRDGDGVKGPDDPAIEDASLIVGGSLRRETSGPDGIVELPALPAGSPVTLELKRSTLSDPFLKPVQTGHTLAARRGQVIALDLPVAQTGEAELSVSLMKGGLAVPVAGVRIEAVDATGAVVGASETSFDGSAYLADLPLGPLTFRVAPAALERIGGASCAPAHVVLSRKAPFASGLVLTIDLP